MGFGSWWASPPSGILASSSTKRVLPISRSWCAQRRHTRGDVIIVRFADDYIVGFQHRDDAERFLAELRGRLAQFSLELAAEKTRLIEFGRFAAGRRQKRGLGKPETFQFLGFTHICGKTKNGRFQLKRIPEAKRLQAKLREVKTELMRRRHLPVPEQGQWLGSVMRGISPTTPCPATARRSTPSGSWRSSTG